jgi:hypothetical protein
MADTHSHDPQVHRHEHTHITQSLRHGQQWAHMDTSHDTRTTTPPSAMPPAGQRRRVLRIGPVIGRCVAVVPSPKLRRVRAELGAWPLRHGGLGSRRAETTQSDYGRHLGPVPMIVLFVPHAAG